MDRRSKFITIALLTQTSNFLMNEIINEDNSNDDDLIDLMLMAAKRRSQRNCVLGFSEYVVISYSNQEFQSHFRLEKRNFEYLLRYLHQISDENINQTTGQPEITLKKKLAVTLWLFGNQEVYRSVADRFNISKSTAWKSVHQICNLLTKHPSKFIKWPTQEEALETMVRWKEVAGFPKIIGAIDGSYIPISAPSMYQESYVCRKKFHAITLQGICSLNKQFIDVFVGCPSSMHDARVYKRSDLKKKIDRSRSELFPNDSHLIGDSAYKNMTHLIVPFKNSRTAAQKKFNKKLSKSRVVIENCFSLLKGRFRRLKYMYMYRTELIPLYVLTCCILHNICLSNLDLTTLDNDIEAEDNGSNNDPEDIDQDDGIHEQTDLEGSNKRNEIMNNLI